MEQGRDGIRRRRRAPRERIADGEFRNVTFRVGARAYNLLVGSAERAEKSVSELGELIIEQVCGNDMQDKIEKNSKTRHLEAVSDTNLSDESKRFLKTIAQALSLYDQSGGWHANDLNRIGSRFAINSVIEHAMPISKEDEVSIYADRPSPPKMAAGKGIDLGSMLWSPLEFLSKSGRLQEVFPQSSLKKDYGQSRKDQE